MYTYQVKSKATGDLVFVYNAASPIEWNQYPFTSYDHIETPYVDPSVPPPPPPSNTTLTRVAFLRRFTQDERIAIRTAAASSPAVQDYMNLLELAEDVSLADPVTIGGVQALETSGILATGRAAEILNG